MADFTSESLADITADITSECLADLPRNTHAYQTCDPHLSHVEPTFTTANTAPCAYMAYVDWAAGSAPPLSRPST
jgi:hypothetical protein